MAPLGAGEGNPQATPTSLSHVLEPLSTVWLSLPAGEGSDIPAGLPEPPTRVLTSLPEVGEGLLLT